jgi:hypothetical protein
MDLTLGIIVEHDKSRFRDRWASLGWQVQSRIYARPGNLPLPYSLLIDIERRARRHGPIE